MEDTPVLKWTLAALGVIVACFCLGYFVLGPTPKQRPVPANGAQVAEVTEGTNPAAGRPAPTNKPGLILEDQTSEIEARMKKLEEEKQKAEEARKKAEEALRQKELAQASPSPSPSVAVVEASPSPQDVIAPEASPVAREETATTTPPPPITPEPQMPTPEPRTATPKPIVARQPPVRPATQEAPHPAASSLFKVQVGPYSTKEAASTMAAELRGRGFSTSIVSEESGSKATFLVQVGAYKSRANADSAMKELQANGYDAKINE